MKAKIYMAIVMTLVYLQLQAQNSDRVKLNAGNEIFGEIKSLKYGGLTFDTDDAGLMNIDWINVLQLESKTTYDITLKDKRRFEGVLESSGIDGEIILVSGSDRVAIECNELVRIVELENSFWSRIDGFINGGLSYTKASDVFSLSLGAEVNYRSFNDEVSIAGNSVLTRQTFSEDSSKTDRNNGVNINYKRFFKHRWFLNIVLGWEQNTELGVQSRIYVGPSFGKVLFESNSNMMRANIGANYTSEISTDAGSPAVSNAEGVIQLYYKAYRKSMPKLNFTAYVYTYPSFTEAGRVRVVGNVDLNTEIIDDFTIGISNYHNYDSEPISATASNYDWGINLTLGYSF